MDRRDFIRTNLEKLRSKQRLSFRDLNQELKINQYTLRKIFDGDVETTRNKALLRAILEFMGQTEDQFFNRTPAALPSDKAPSAVEQRVPLYGEIPAGNPVLIEGKQQPDEWIEAPPGLKRNVFALRVKGQSMYPRFMPGDVIFFEPLNIHLGAKDPQNPVPSLVFERLNGRVVAALLENEATLKQLKIIGAGDNYELELRPFNPEYKPIRIKPDHSVIFQGVAVKTMRDENGEIF